MLKETLKKDEIAAMKADAEAHKAEDEKREEEMNKLNIAQAYCNSIDKVLEDEVCSKSLKDDIKNVISTLKEREQEVVKMRYGLDDTERYTLEEIGNIYGVTKECIRQTELRALKKMKMTGENLLSCYIY